MRPAPLQRALPLRARPTWDGRRPGAGRKPGPRPWVPRIPRPPHAARHPVHVTLRAVPGLPSFRSARVFPSIREALRLASHDGFRLVHFSVQSNHLHLLVEAHSRQALIRGVQGLVIRLARAVNRVLSRRGRVFADRYHARALATPREVRNVLVYVLMNMKKHQPAERGLDLCSSAPWFTGWRQQHPVPPPGVLTPVADARTWLLRVGWHRHGLIAVSETPRRA